MSAETRYVVYRLWAADDSLLYIGSTGNWPLRMTQHQRHQPWWGQITRTALDYFPTREAAYAAERIAIQLEHPRHNKVHNNPVRQAAEAARRAAREAAARDGAAALVMLAASAWLLGQWGAEQIRWQASARRALAAGGAAPPRPGSPFLRDTPARAILEAAVTRPPVPAVRLPRVVPGTPGARPSMPPTGRCPG